MKAKRKLLDHDLEDGPGEQKRKEIQEAQESYNTKMIEPSEVNPRKKVYKVDDMVSIKIDRVDNKFPFHPNLLLGKVLEIENNYVKVVTPFGRIALEVPDGEISPKASDAKPEENSPLIINADRSTPMTLADQLAEYRLQQKQKFISQSTTAISESSTQPSIANSTVNCLIGDSLVKNIESRKLSRACRGKTIVECSRGAKIKDIHKKA